MVEDKVYDNIISLENQSNIKDTLMSSNFPWYFLNDITLGTKENGRPGFSHIYYKDGAKNSAYSVLVDLLVEKGLELIQRKGKIIQARSFLQFPCNHQTYDTPHVDLWQDHIVFLYYVCDSDGNTVLFDERQNFDKEVPQGFNVKQEVQPKQGRFLVFNGNNWHTAFQPKKSVRCIINIDINIF